MKEKILERIHKKIKIINVEVNDSYLIEESIASFFTEKSYQFETIPEPIQCSLCLRRNWFGLGVLKFKIFKILQNWLGEPEDPFYLSELYKEEFIQITEESLVQLEKDLTEFIQEILDMKEGKK